MVNQAFYPCLGVFIAVHLMKNVKLSLENCICNVMKMLPYSSISKEISCQKRHTSVVISIVLGRSCAQAFFFSIFPELNTSVNLMKTFRTMWWQYWKGFQQIIPRNMRDTRMHMCMHKIRKTLWMCPHHPRFSDKTHTFFSGSVWISINQLQISHAQELVTRLVHSWHAKLCFAFSCLVY